MSATKEQELKALGKIRNIVDELGECSYIKTAFTGAFELAEKNIIADFGTSTQWYIDEYRKLLNKIGEANNKLEFMKKNYELRINCLQADLDRELDWKPYEYKENVSQSEYNELLSNGCTKELTDEEAKKFIYDWFGFCEDRIEIVREVSTLEKNKYNHVRTNGKTERKPLFNAFDWHYIHFCVCGKLYEIYNEELRPFYD